MAEVGQRSLQWDKDSVAKYRKDLEGKGIVFVEEKDGLNIPAFRKAVLAQIGKDFPEWTPVIEKIQAIK
jgi:TRAP-type C4-dicarboxylate transport system substrate-binding protein